MNLIIFDKTGKKVDILQNYTSIQWERSYAGTGKFEIHVFPTKENVENLVAGQTRLVNQETLEIGFITYLKDEDDYGQKKDDIEIRGYFDNLDQRINCRTWHFGKNVESDLISCILFNRRGLDVQIKSSQIGLVSNELDMESTWKTLRDTVQLVCAKTGYGYRMVADKMSANEPQSLNQFNLYQGNKRNVKFSDKLSNITFQKIEFDYSKYKNYAYVCAQGEGEQRTVVEVDLTNGSDRYELYVDSRNTSKKYQDKNGVERTYSDAEYRALLQNEGLEALGKYSAIKNFTCTVDTNDPLFKFREEYDLGDIVTVESVRYNIHDTLYRISGVKEIDENGKQTVEIELNLYSEELKNREGGNV